MRGLPGSMPAGPARFFSFILGLGLLACHGAPVAKFPSVETALGRLKAQTDCSRAVTADADLILSGTFFSMRGKVLYMAQAPNKLRFDLYSSFGVTLSTLTSDGENFGLYSLEDKSFWYGPAKTCNLERFTRVPVPPFALVELLRGRPPVLAHSEKMAEMRFTRPWFSHGHYQIDIRGDHESEQRIKLGIFREDWDKPLSKQRLRLLGVRVKQGGDLVYEVKLSAHRKSRRLPIEPSEELLEMGIGARPPTGPECEAELPGILKFVVPDTGYSLTIENQESSHNPPISQAAFRQNMPQGVVTEYSNCVD